VDDTGNPFTGVSAISAGAFHTIALKTDGSLWAWGDGWRKGLGDGTHIDRLNPVPVTVISNIPSLRISQIIAGGAASYVLSENGSIWGWGKNNRGQLGNGIRYSVAKHPVQMTSTSGEPFKDIISFDAAWATTGFLKDDGTVWMCGYNERGQLGIGVGLEEKEWVSHPVKVRDTNNRPFV